MNISYDLTFLPIVHHIGHGMEGLGIQLGEGGLLVKNFNSDSQQFNFLILVK